ncbi:hypothetical protein GDO86_003170 [Hymenochirus boettgeri]|uniref:Fork-head domain-containing protein n=1 Tax=Hymenochirus boettgeri TaxID=247094 RepID=A0A8T2K0A1_9PIPI|nr:hypothetical protein GDO86_003170 [Hymenochirus boettgeri]
MQDQSNLTFSSGSLDNECSPINQAEDGILDGSSCFHMDTNNFSSQIIDTDIQPKRKNSDSSVSLSSSPQDHIQIDFPSKPSSNEVFRRFSYDDTTERSYSNFIKERNQFHPYRRQFSDGYSNPTFKDNGESPTFKDNGERRDVFEELCSKALNEHNEPFASNMADISSEQPWCNSMQYNSSLDEGSQIMLSSDIKMKPLEMQHQEKEQRMYWSQSQTQQLYCSPQTFPQYPTGGSYPVTYISTSHYPYQRIAPQANMESQQPLYPKPLYSYSILIFMALKNSKTGSLPVSEIYNFMTEHFPYFKTAPDGWKNSVRHNLSLNKCFEKVENKSGSSSRKGCLWALNPAKIDKMQEELQKWKRKDPVTVRKSMAKPDDLDKLIGERTEKLRSSLMAHSAAGLVSNPNMQLPMQTSLGGSTVSSSVPLPLTSLHDISGSLHDKSVSRQQPHCYMSLPHDIPQISPALIQQPHNLSQNHFTALDNPRDQRGQSTNSQDSPIPAHTPPLQTIKILSEHSPSKTMQDNFTEVDMSNDIDDLTPSLTDFDFQGNLWDELNDGSLALDPLNLVSSSPTPPPQYFLNNTASVVCNNGIGVANNNSHLNFTDFHLTYSSFMELEKPMTSYFSSSGNKHVATV